jgi:hypothetical protein
MEKIEASTFFTNVIKDLWPTWKPTRMEEELFISTLLPFEESVAKPAAGKLKRSQFGDKCAPSTYHFTQMCHSLITGNTTTSKHNTPEPIAFIQCQSHPTKPHLVGTSRPIYKPHDIFDPDVIRMRIGKIAVRFSKLYDGYWVAIHGATFKEMREQAN